jgi:hypothetical protein
MSAVAPHREEFEFDRHCSGPNLDATPNDIIRRIERYSGVKLAEAFAIPDLDREVKLALQICPPEWHSRLADFHVTGWSSPTWSSGDPIADWVARLSDH